MTVAPLSGYINYYMTIEDDKLSDNIKRWDIDGFSADVDDGEAVELIIEAFFEYVPLKVFSDVIQKIIQKLRRGGSLVITCTDAYTTAKKFVNCEISPEAFNMFIYGGVTTDDFKVSGLILSTMCEYLERERGIEILSRRLEDMQFIIIGKRK
jgi:hypothetical protein